MYYFQLPTQECNKIRNLGKTRVLYKVWRESWFKYGLILRIIPLYLENILEMWKVWDFHERRLSIKMLRNLATSTY